MMIMNGAMKKIFVLFLFVLWWGTSFARIKVLCDVVYEKSIGEWSTFYRTEVEFLSGSEMDLINSSNKLCRNLVFTNKLCYYRNGASWSTSF